jgi:hypothetical protein
MGVVPHSNPAALRALLKAAEGVDSDPPSALLWACGRYPRAFGATWVATSLVLVEYQARLVSTLVVLSVEEFRPVLLSIARGERDHEAVRGWLSERSMPLPPGSLGLGPRGQG